MLFTRVELDVLLASMYLASVGLLALMAWKRTFPSVSTLVAVAALFNTKGGIIMFLWIAWLGTLTTTVVFGIWVIRVGVDPQHTVVTILMGMLISQAFGNVNGALFKTMTGEETVKSVTAKIDGATTTQSSSTPVTGA